METLSGAKLPAALNHFGLTSSELSSVISQGCPLASGPPGIVVRGSFGRSTFEVASTISSSCHVGRSRESAFQDRLNFVTPGENPADANPLASPLNDR
ncbi:hypothetical protein KM043_011215 [Ampulex compressa]|nr:hypothetical protein KM043_011215 [Ampulex compressa]